MRVWRKLVRDRIPDILRGQGKPCEVRTLGPGEYHAALLAKLEEEALEARESGGSLEELADVLEVLRALLAARGVAWEDLERARQRKRASRGGFEARVWLERGEE
ncbi:putative house-cleaning noncanonical NTP pyrophosphatase (MazG superfamily) [Deinobacterium chartae]|uniref:Putative house-cleaning noncanonical NTP pyrophosphatase (MazG superfamily) n=1 Tax=Deinobacterium chartae TaxID=521158 RepID=A0A841I3P3_9DEIO|nr:nucleoside triphosphate pyrophosphohydrolase [Deinobacterium chartae]MBB6099656.1 putative house-cleaning noncanonical NTP pyrophosphatase (MazG superfamily) [Deinobacterium chartae]